MDLLKVVALNYLRFNKPKQAKIYLKEFTENNSFEFEIEKQYVEFAEKEIKKAEKLNVKIIPFYDEKYPEALSVLKDKPLLLYVKGDFISFPNEAIAVVGSRKCSNYGKSVAYKIAYDLGGAGVTVVSGLAYGIDSAAHNGALDANGRTIAVLGSGVDIIYPKDHINLAKKIENNGFLVSEFPFGATPLKYNFPFRNRIISALSLGVVVVEAELKSGSLITATHAIEQGKEVFAVPGNITNPTSAGSNALIRDGAIPLLDVNDIFENIKELSHLKSNKDIKQFSEIEQFILNALEDGDTFDTLKEKISIGNKLVLDSELLVVLTSLEVKRYIKKSAGRYYKI
ncbi:DNA-processing protein DprA [Caldisericum exile]|uniref:DNA processing protein n=1 Tax=Caldisericum exile (strain DSM 21853 / NBRC 104410 / AZM16c01) TaxID=511051 RepID=A0A7U6JFE5_CALEA|nr:DNA-processing protein DprA [Caldisericum exile]BAL81393.1 putative DNA processing protein [Caldisericum exile AZM16c01]